MTQQEAIDALDKKALKGDNEIAHQIADGVLLDFLRSNGFAAVADAYDKARDDVGFWYA